MELELSSCSWQWQVCSQVQHSALSILRLKINFTTIDPVIAIHPSYFMYLHLVI